MRNNASEGSRFQLPGVINSRNRNCPFVLGLASVVASMLPALVLVDTRTCPIIYCAVVLVEVLLPAWVPAFRSHFHNLSYNPASLGLLMRALWYHAWVVITNIITI